MNNLRIRISVEWFKEMLLKFLFILPTVLHISLDY